MTRPAVYCPACTRDYYRKPRWGGVFKNGEPVTVETLRRIRDADARPPARRERAKWVKRGEFFCQGCGITLRRA